MFKFNFEEENDTDAHVHRSLCESENGNACTEVEITHDICYLNNNEKIKSFSSDLIELKYISPDIGSLEEPDVTEAILQHSDLIPGKYEGGFKIWECTQDLVNYILSDYSHRLQKGNSVLDLGCGAGILGIVALLNDCVVHFQDYNASVINSFTIPNTLLNVKEAIDTKKCRYFTGDWLSFLKLIQADDKIMYDIIVSSETIYNPLNYCKLLAIFKDKLKKTGDIFVAAKACYFGVGGSVHQFKKFVEEDGTFTCRRCWSSKEGVQREVLHLKFQDT